MRVTPGTRRGYAKGRAKRIEILDQAMALFGEAGYRGASLRVIATRCGISHPGLLHHFPTKEALLLAVLQRRDDVDDEWLALGVTRGVDHLRRLVDLAELNAKRRGIVELFSVVAAEATSPITRPTPTSRPATARPSPTPNAPTSRPATTAHYGPAPTRRPPPSSSSP